MAKSKTIKNKKHRSRIIQYLVTGGAWFWSGYAMFALCYSVLKLDIITSKVIAYLFGLTVNFILERFWVFDDKKSARLQKVGGRYLALSALNLGIDTLIVWGLAEMGVTPYIGQFISAGFFTVWNYVWYTAWVFARGKPGPQRSAAPHLHRSKHARGKA